MIPVRSEQLRGADEDLVNVLDCFDQAMFVVDPTRRLRGLNPAAERLVARADALRLAHGQVSAIRSDVTQHLQDLVTTATRPALQERRRGVMAAPSPIRRLPLSLTVIPLRPSPVEAGSSILALLCVTDLEAELTVSHQTLREVFGLTPAETRVAVALFHGASPKEVSQNLSISLPTVRIHLARIFEKTHTRRQAELAHLMMRIAAAPLV